MELKDYLKESFNKEYGYRVKFACDCSSEQKDIIEQCLAKYGVVSISDFKRKPIDTNKTKIDMYLKKMQNSIKKNKHIMKTKTWTWTLMLHCLAKNIIKNS